MRLCEPAGWPKRTILCTQKQTEATIQHVKSCPCHIRPLMSYLFVASLCTYSCRLCNDAMWCHRCQLCQRRLAVCAKVVKPAGDFNKDPRTTGALTSACKECQGAAKKVILCFSLMPLAVSDHVSRLQPLLKVVVIKVVAYTSVAGSNVDCVSQLVGLECSIVCYASTN